MAELTYLDFDLHIEGTGGKYRARVQNSPGGEALSEFSTPFESLELENFLLRVGRPRSGVRRLNSPEMEAAKKVGAQLFEAVFQDEVFGAFRASVQQAGNEGKGLRVRLRVDAPELGDLPWEYLYNPRQDEFLSLSVETPIVRYVEIPRRFASMKVKLPLMVLVMISSPSDYPPLEVEREWQNLKTALADLEASGLVQLERLEIATLGALQQHLRPDDYHIFHFIGHGGFEEATQDGVLLFEDENRRGRKLSGHYLGTILRDERPLRLAILNACEGARTSQRDPFAGVAQNLVRRGIPAVIAMQFEITDRAAITFSRELYSAIADGYPVDAALAEARKAIFAQGNDIEWGTPVYFTRTKDGRIFNLDIIKGRTPVVRRARPSRVDPKQEKQLNNTYIDGLGAYYIQDWKRARINLQDVVAVDPNYKEAAKMLAEVENLLKREALFQQAQAALEKDDFVDAKKHLEELISEDPDNQEAVDQLKEVNQTLQVARLTEEARQLHARGQAQAVISVITRIQKIDPDYVDHEGLLQTAQTILDNQKQQAVLEKTYNQALQAVGNKNWAAAEELLMQVAQQEETHRDTQPLLARVRVEIEREKTAERQTQVSALLQEAEEARKQEKWDVALEKTQAGLALIPDHPGAKEELKQVRSQQKLDYLYQRGKKLQASGDYVGALEVMRQVQAEGRTYKDVLTRIETLQEKVKAEETRRDDAQAAREKAAAKPRQRFTIPQVKSRFKLPVSVVAGGVVGLGFLCALTSWGANQFGLLGGSQTTPYATEIVAEIVSTATAQPIPSDTVVPKVTETPILNETSVPPSTPTMMPTDPEPKPTHPPATPTEQSFTLQESLNIGVRLGSIAISPDGQTLVAGTVSAEGLVRLWDTGTGEVLRDLDSGIGTIWDLHFSEDGTLLLAGGNSNVEIWDTTTWRSLGELRGSEIGDFLITPDKNNFITWGWMPRGGAVRIWDAATYQSIKWLYSYRILIGFVPDTNNAWLMGDSLDLVDIFTEEVLQSAEPFDDFQIISDDGRLVVTQDQRSAALTSGPVKIWTLEQAWDLSSRSLLRTIVTELKFPDRIALSPDNSALVIGGRSGGAVELWEIVTGDLIHSINLENECTWVTELVFTADGNTLAMGCDYEGVVQLWRR